MTKMQRNAVGAGRGKKSPPESKVKSISVCLMPHTLARLDAHAMATGQSRSAIVDEAICRILSVD